MEGVIGPLINPFGARADSCPECGAVLVLGMVLVETTAYNSHGDDGHPEQIRVPGIACLDCGFQEATE